MIKFGREHMENEQKKYCIFAAQFLPHMGGIENYTYNISKELIRRGNQVTIITNNTTDSPLQETVEGMRVLRFPCFNFINGRFPIMKLNRDFWKIHRYLKKQHYDIVVINARFYLHSIYAAVYAKHKKIKQICIEHGTSHLSVHNKVLDFIGGVYEHLHTAVLKLICKDYYGVAEACCEWSGHFGIKSKGVLYNAVDLDKIELLKTECKRDFREEYEIDQEAVVIAFTGRLLKEKGVYELIEAVERYNQKNQKVYLLLAGEGEEMEYVNEHRSKYVIPLGRLPFEEIIALLVQSDIFCLPSISEGFSTSALEAAACRCYIITTERGGTKELVAGLEYGIVMPNNSVENIYQAITKAAQDRELKRRGQELCYDRLKNEFTWQHTTDALERIVKN